jgi:fumarate reductase flavoprotein subunit
MSQSDEMKATVELSRRGFLKAGGAAVGAVVLGSVAGCGNDTTRNITTASTTQGSTTTSSNWYGTEPSIGSVVEEVSTDILIVGAGIAGCYGALAAAEGAKTLVIEKGSTNGGKQVYLGAYGTTAQNDAGVKMDYGELLNDLARYASNKCNYDLIRMWLDESAATIAWALGYLTKYGIYHVAEYDVGDGYHGYFKEWPTHTKWMTDKSDTGVIDALIAEAQALGAEYRYSTSLVKLITSGSKVTGAYAKNDKGYVKITASKAVILCTGGYANDPELYTKLNPYAASVTTMYFGNNGNCVGDGIKAGIWAGGRIQTTPSAMIFDRGPVKPGMKAGYPFHNELLMGSFAMGSQPYMKVNMAGNRFMNESSPYDWPLFAAGYQDDGVYCVIFDANYWDNIIAYHTIGCSRQVLSTSVPATGEGLGKDNFDSTLSSYISAGIIQQADSIAELASKLNLSADALAATVSRYNGFAASGVDSDFGKPAKDLFAISTAPFYGYVLGANLLTTLDGLIIDKHCRVTKLENSVETAIQGLYAAGDTTGGFFDTNYPELVVGVASGRTVTQVRHAVRHALGKIS